MSFNDKAFGAIFPTRDGVATGSSNERQMLDKLGGAEGFKKTYRTLTDGSVVRCSTRNGMPEFVVERTAETPSTTELFPYMESGVLEFSYPGDQNPTRIDPATWHIVGVSPTSRWLGEIKTSETLGDQSTAQAGTLYDGIDSAAIGYPRDGKNKSSYEGSVVQKKIVAGLFPSSLFSGKMRLFVQAQYGAGAKTGSFKFTTNVVGESALLYYNDVQLGFLASNSPGIFTAPDKTFWLLVILRGNGTNYIVKAYPLRQNSYGTALMAKYKAGEYSQSEKDELEAYIFAHSHIDTTASTLVGVFDAGTDGSALAYGWKWKEDGSEASIVVHKMIPYGGKSAFSATTLKVSFSYSNGAFSLSSTATPHGTWCDGWGGHNIFVPYEITSSAPLECFSLFWAGYRTFSYSGIPVYGYYIDDEWSPVVLTREYVSYGEGTDYTQFSSGITYPTASDENSVNNYQFGYAPADQSIAYEGHYTEESTKMTLAFAGQSYVGTSLSGTHNYVYRNLLGSSWSVVNQVSWLTGMFAPSSWGDYPSPSGYPSASPTSIMVECSRASLELYSFTGIDHNAWALVIPPYDAEAIYVAKHRSYVDNSSTWSRIYTEFDAPIRFYGTTSTGTYTFSPWATTGSDWSWYGINQNLTHITDADPHSENETTVFASNAVAQWVQGTPGGSYSSLFNVDYNYPFYDRGMSMLTSFGGKYVGSEGVTNVDNLPSGRFVGWF